VLLGWDRLVLFSHGSPLRNARFIAGLSQDELAAQVGSTRQTISALERGTSIPSVSLALALARALGYSVEELFADVDGG
jgi:putative transcriptional regulator